MAVKIRRERTAVWEQALRRAPLGVVVLGTILGLLGAGSLLGGIYLGIARPDI